MREDAGRLPCTSYAQESPYVCSAVLPGGGSEAALSYFIYALSGKGYATLGTLR